MFISIFGNVFKKRLIDMFLLFKIKIIIVLLIIMEHYQKLISRTCFLIRFYIQFNIVFISEKLLISNFLKSYMFMICTETLNVM